MAANAADVYDRAQRRRAEAAAILVRRQWRRMDPGKLDQSWAEVVGRLTGIVAAAMLGAAREGSAYVAEAAGAAEAEVVADRFADGAADGRPLDSLLFSAVVHAKQTLGRGASPRQGLESGGKWLDMLTRTQINDAGRDAVSVGIAVRPEVGYTRYVAPPCCQRCAVLAGKFFRWNDGFLRHPRCDCRHLPCTEQAAPGLTADISPAQIRDLSEAQRQAIADGADLNQVVNARRGRSGMTTTEGTTRRGLAGQRGVRRRLTPEAIYRVSATREEAVSRLRANGYIL